MIYFLSFALEFSFFPLQKIIKLKVNGFIGCAWNKLFLN